MSIGTWGSKKRREAIARWVAGDPARGLDFRGEKLTEGELALSFIRCHSASDVVAAAEYDDLWANPVQAKP